MNHRIKVLVISIAILCVTTMFKAVGNNIFYNSDNPYDFFQNISISIDAYSIHSIYQDSNGTIWFGTKNGLYSYNGYNFHSYKSEFDSNGNVVNCIRPIGDHTVFLGTDRSLIAFDLKTKQFSEIVKDVPEVRALALIDDTLWIGTYNSGLFSYDLKSEKLTCHKIDNKVIPLISDLEIVDDQLYVGSYSGLACVDAGEVRWVNTTSVF